MKLNKSIFISLLLFPAIIYAYQDPRLRNKVMEETLLAMETQRHLPLQKEKGPVKWFMSEDLYMALGLQLAYIKGNTAYDFDHHTSELEYPMDNGMVGSNLILGFKNLSFNSEAWIPFEKDAGFEMKDKDWDSNGNLTSYTKSRAKMNAIIWDASLQYDFYKMIVSKNIDFLTLLAQDEIKIGALIGYRYERFDYDMYELYYPELGITLYQGQKVLTYKVKYHIPYVGLATNILHKDTYGLDLKFKYGLHPTGEDLDNHVLRGLTFYGDYDKNGEVLIGSITGFWEWKKNCKFKFGAEGSFIRIDGITWEESHDPSWDKDQSTDARHWIFWSGFEYKF